MSESFTHLLKTWRKKHKLTQRELSEIVGTSSRIISFLETGREKPTRQMVERLSKALSLHEQAHIDLIIAAGFSPGVNQIKRNAYHDDVMDAALLLIKSHEPYPAIIVDANYDVLAVNDGIVNRIEELLGQAFDHSVLPVSLIDIILHPQSVGQAFKNIDEVARFVLQRYHRESMALGAALDPNMLKERFPYLDKAVLAFDESYQPTPQITVNSDHHGHELVTTTIVTTVGLSHDLGGDSVRVLVSIPINQNAIHVFNGNAHLLENTS